MSTADELRTFSFEGTIFLCGLHKHLEDIFPGQDYLGKE